MRSHLVLLACVALLVAGAIVTAGNLNPPAGPVTPTMKSLDEIEPRTAISATNTPGDAGALFRITQPGSYYLTGNLTGVTGKHCIEFGTDGITLDLNGFALIGVTGSLSGVYINSDRATVRNGTIHNFKVGIDAYEAAGARFQNLTVTSSVNQNFRASVGAILENCFSEYGTVGFDVFETATLTACVSRYASLYGFEVEDGCTLTNCTATNAQIGFYAHGPCVLTNCTSQTNSIDGFRADESSIFTDCTAFDNDGAGFSGIARCRFTHCNSRNNQYGFYLTEANAVIECTATANSSNGVRIGGNANSVERSTCHENGASGINIATGVANSIDSNLLTYNGTSGLFITTGDNISTRNRARGNANGNYTFGGNNEYAVILTNPGAGFTSSSAWANFSY